MTVLPNRISAFGQLTPAREAAMARQLVDIRSEHELDHFLPLLAAAAPVIANIAGPLLKNLAGSLFGGGSSKKKRPRDQQEYFLGGIVKGLLGGELESAEQEQFLGGILKGIMGGELESYEQEQFLGGILGKLLGGEMEAENYVQEQFLGGIVKGLLGGEMELPPSAPPPPDHPHHDHHRRRMLHRAHRFVRFVHAAASEAAAHLATLPRSGQPPTQPELQRIVLASLVSAARRLLPRLSALAFPRDAASASAGGPSVPPHLAFGAPPSGAGGQPKTMLEMMIAESTPLGAGSRRRANGYPLA